jgi:hypothetical protein
MFNAEFSMLVMFGLVLHFMLLVGVLALVAHYNNKAITAEVLKANRRLEDQMNSRVG